MNEVISVEIFSFFSGDIRNVKKFKSSFFGFFFFTFLLPPVGYVCLYKRSVSVSLCYINTWKSKILQMGARLFSREQLRY